jgi:hypothetical protein
MFADLNQAVYSPNHIRLQFLLPHDQETILPFLSPFHGIPAASNGAGHGREALGLTCARRG